MTGERVVVRASRALVALYPRRLREEYGADMVELVRDQCRDESAGRVGARFVLDLAITLPKTHLEARMHRIPRSTVPLIYLALSLGGLLMAILGGTSMAMFAIGLGLSLIAGALALRAWRHTAPAAETQHTGAWWKFVLAGPVLVGVVILAAEAGVESWFLGVATVLTAFVLTVVGVVLGVIHLAGRSRPIAS